MNDITRTSKKLLDRLKLAEAEHCRQRSLESSLLGEAVGEIERLRKVYDKANALIAYIGQQGEISSTAGEVDALQCALDDYDCGTPVSAHEPEPALPVALQGALGRLSMTMGNPAVQWAERSCIEAALVEEAIRRLSQPPFLKRRPYLEESDAWASAEDERDWWRNYALQIEEACLRPTKGEGQ